MSARAGRGAAALPGGAAPIRGGRARERGTGSWKLLPLVVLAACMVFYVGSNLAVMSTGIKPDKRDEPPQLAPLDRRAAPSYPFAGAPLEPRRNPIVEVRPEDLPQALGHKPLAEAHEELIDAPALGADGDPLRDGPYHYKGGAVEDDDGKLVQEEAKKIEQEAAKLAENVGNSGDKYWSGPILPAGTPAKQAKMDCSKISKGEGVGSIRNIAYWLDDPRDKKFRSPLVVLGPKEKFVTFEPDHGGWNNIRMAMECVLMFAASTGRTLVLPPEQPMYLLHEGEVHFEDFFPVELLSTRMDVIDTRDFLAFQGQTGKLNVTPPEAAIELQHHAVYKYYESVGAQYGEHGLPALNPGRVGIVLPFDVGGKVDPRDPRWKAGEFDGWLAGRKLIEYDRDWQNVKVVHWRAADKSRLLSHFYTWVMDANPRINNYYKRMVRDIWHYRDEIFCKASQVITMILAEIPENGTYSSMHIRRGDFQFTAVRMEAQAIFDETYEYLKDKEFLYIATDERNKTFFKPFFERYQVRFLDDYFERAQVGELSKNFIGMIEQIIASHGRTFTGTWWSTFTGYILRMRGYYGHPRKSNWYFYPERRELPHQTQWPIPPFWMTEWYQGWEGINDEGPPDASEITYAPGLQKPDNNAAELATARRLTVRNAQDVAAEAALNSRRRRRLRNASSRLFK